MAKQVNYVNILEIIVVANYGTIHNGEASQLCHVQEIIVVKLYCVDRRFVHTIIIKIYRTKNFKPNSDKQCIVRSTWDTHETAEHPDGLTSTSNLASTYCVTKEGGMKRLEVQVEEEVAGSRTSKQTLHNRSVKRANS